MAGMGPPPKPADQRRRRNAPTANTTVLPGEGRCDDPPAWPLSGDAPAVWAELWATPQSVMWERHGWTRVVARYALLLEPSESIDAGASLLNEVRQLEDRLGLSPMAMLRLRWEVSADEVAAARSDRSEAEKKPKRRVLKVVPDAVAGA